MSIGNLSTSRFFLPHQLGCLGITVRSSIIQAGPGHSHGCLSLNDIIMISFYASVECLISKVWPLASILNTSQNQCKTNRRQSQSQVTHNPRKTCRMSQMVPSPMVITPVLLSELMNRTSAQEIPFQQHPIS